MSGVRLRETMLELLLRIEQSKSFSHLLIDQEINSGRINKKDEGFLTEVIYGTLQYKLRLDYILDEFVQTKKQPKPWVLMLLRMSIYQMIYLDRVPDHAIIHEAVEIAKTRGHKGIASFVNGILRNIQRNGIPDTTDIKDDIKRISIETSHPEWMIKRWIEFYGKDVTEQMAKSNLTRKSISIRIQPLRITREEAIQSLEAEGLEVRASELSPQGIVILKGNVLRTKLFKDGLCTIQDESSMLVAEMLDVEPNMKVLDSCSAPGGKATHIAEKMQNQGELDAFDLHEKKANLIKKKAKELGLSIIHARGYDARKLQEIYQAETFDRIVVDAPCSGLGVVRGKPDIKYNKTEADIHNLATIQKDILNHVAPLLKTGGKLIYSTCTVNKEENENIVQDFLETHQEFAIDQSFFKQLPDALQDSIGESKYGLQLFPQNFDTDGFFLVRFVKNG